MFQSLWNVAAAFCVHERSDSDPSVSMMNKHFGHHEALHCEPNQPKFENKKAPLSLEKIKWSGISLADDHRDHLPSFASFLLSEITQKIDDSASTYDLSQPLFDWKNLYQSPDLFLVNPPPVFAPLLVG